VLLSLAGARGASLVAKLRPPQRLAAQVARVEICERIFAAGAVKLVLLRAPAGFGKTTAMLQVRERFLQTGLPTAWLTLDRADNDVGRFLAGLTAALSPLIPGLPRVEESESGSPDQVALALIDRIAAHPTPFALFCDDFEAVQNPAVAAIVAELIEQFPRGAQMIMGSRGVPELGLGRLRARGRLLEIEPSQLRFSEAEANGFLRELRGLTLEPDDVRRLHRSTEGWAAALWLASVSLEKRDAPGSFIAGFSGSNAAVVDYLVEDVLAHQSESVRDFLLRTSVLAELNPSLCDAVTGREDSAAVLRAIDQAHLFLTPLQGDRSQYRYHNMFAEFLRVELARQMPDQLPRIHRSAARWFEAQRRPVPAIEHALAAQDLHFALSLLVRHAQALLDQGRVRLLSRWLDPLLASGQLDAHPMLQVVHAWAVCFARGPRAAAALLDRLEARNDEDPEVIAHRLAMRPLFLALMDRTDEALSLAEQALVRLPPGVAFVSGFLEVTMARLAMIAGRYNEALRFADAARARQPAHASDFNLALSEATEAVVDLLQGRLRKAITGLRLAVSGGALEGTRTTNGNALAGVPLAQALYEAGQLDQAERLLVVYIPLIRGVTIPDELIMAHVVMARILAERGDDDRAERLLLELERIGHREGLPRVVAGARLERVRILLMQDKLARARSELDRSGDRALWQRVARLSHQANEVETHDVAFARWAVRSGHAEEVLGPLRAELDAAERGQRGRRALTLRLLYALALYRDGQRNKGMRQLAAAVEAATREGYVRAVLDEGTPLLAMLAELRKMPDVLAAHAGTADVLAFIDALLPPGPQGQQPPDAPVDTAPAAPAVDAEVLTRKEVQVLRLAAQGLSNDQLAERLFIAETTVRTHLRNINVKLDARNRMEAIAVARRLGLMD
jgi:LuxR family maltose regulon positive regulatory protein